MFDCPVGVTYSEEDMDGPVKKNIEKCWGGEGVEGCQSKRMKREFHQFTRRVNRQNLDGYALRVGGGGRGWHEPETNTTVEWGCSCRP